MYAGRRPNNAVVLLLAIAVAGCAATASGFQDSKARAFVRAMASSDFTAAASQLGKSDDATTKNLATSWTTYERDLGSYQRILALGHATARGKTVEQLEVQMSNAKGLVQLTYGSNGVLQSVELLRWPKGQ